jgi:eukaryotic-like serine/threonine-protein kinase
MIGRVVGNYRILAELGAGGMGLVYKAQDIRLDRFLALKFLKPERVTDEFRRRFLQEARASSALHHPAIVHIYDIGQWEGRDYIAMEYVEGSTLHAVLQQRTLSVEEALGYAVQVADALTVAHAAGIVHRDLKPGNLMVTPDGHVKVVDFGLAKVAPAKVGPDGSPSDSTQAETVTSSQTIQGIAIGSPAYMSPEQAAGKAVDARTDIFAFGSVLFEMLTGRRAFVGDTLIEVMGAVLHAQVPRPSSLNPLVNDDLDSVVARCLQKKPADRFQEMSEVARALKTGRAIRTARIRRPPARGTAAALGLAALLAGAYFIYRGRRPSTPVLGPVSAERLTFDAGVNIEPSISADGKFVAYASDRGGKDNLDIWLKQIHGGDPIQLTSDPANDHSPDVSPDGTSVVFRSERNGGGIYMVPALGGRDTLLVPEGRRPRFSPDGQQIVYWKGVDGPFPLRRGSGETFVFDRGTLQSRPIAADFAAAVDPVWSPDGKSILFVGLKDAADAAHTFDWWIVPVNGGPPAKCPFLTAAMYVPYAWRGDYVYYDTSDPGILRIRLDAKTRQPAGQAEHLTLGTADESGPSPGADGGLVFASMVQKTNIFGLPLDADRGSVTGAPKSITNNLGENMIQAISADGRRIAFMSSRPKAVGFSIEVWAADLAAGSVHALVTGDRAKGMLSIRPDGSSVTWRETYGSVRQIFTIPFEGGVSSRLCDGCTGVVVWSPDGTRALYPSATAPDTLLLREIGTGKESVYLRGGNRELRPSAISRDGRWLVFAAVNLDNRADYATYVAPFRPETPPAEAEWVKVLSAEEGYPAARWSPDGNLLYFFSKRDGHECLWALRLDPRTKRPAGEPLGVRHFHSPALELNPGSIFVVPAIAPERAVVTLSENSSSLWLLSGRK